jgi:hypothetical protein
MKKINLNLTHTKEMLTIQQMKKITGGYPTNTITCSDGGHHQGWGLCSSTKITQVCGPKGGTCERDDR